jgi:hypothetical protein
MAVARSLESYAQRLDIETDLVRLLGRRCAAWIEVQSLTCEIGLIRTRDYLPPSTAFYVLPRLRR